MATETRGLGLGKRQKAGGSSGLANPSSVVPVSPSEQTRKGGGTTHEQLGEKCEHPELPGDHLLLFAAVVDCAEVLPSRSQVFAPAIPVGPSGAGTLDEHRLVSSSRPAEDRLAPSSRASRRRVSSKRPPNADEGVSAKRLKLDTG